MSDIELHYDTLNVGKTITCLMHSFRTETPCVLISPIPPFNLDLQYERYDFSWLGLDKPTPLQLWDRLCFLLGMSGILLFPNNVSGYRQENENFTIVTNYNKKIKINYNKINLFDDQETGWNNVYDFFDWRSGSSHGLREIKDEEDTFVSTIKFYPSERKLVSSEVLDMVAISYLSDAELDDIETSSIYSRLKLLRMIKEAGITGAIAGYNSKGLPFYKKPVIEFRERIVVPDYKPIMTFDEVYKIKQKKGYTWKLLEKITQHTST